MSSIGGMDGASSGLWARLDTLLKSSDSREVVTEDRRSEGPHPAGPVDRGATPHADRSHRRQRLHAADWCRPSDAANCPPAAAPAAPGSADTSVGYRRSERTTIYVRTQEGDVVRLKIKLRESIEAESSRASAEDASSELRVAARTSARIAVHVEGNLSEAERDAIASVLDQASELAEEFFSGDFEAAFETAAQFQIDGTQLANVALRMSVSEQLTYSRVGRSPAAEPALPAPASEPAPAAPQPSAAPVDAAAPEADPVASGSPLVAAPANSPVLDETTPNAPAPTADPSTPTPATNTAALMAAVMHAISGFLGHVIEAFDDASSVETTHGIKLDMSLKIRLLESVITATLEVEAEPETGAAQPVRPPVESSAPALLADALDNLAAARDTRLLEVA